MEENKPQETDSEETSETLDELFESSESEEAKSEGDGDVPEATKEDGFSLTKEELESIIGRKVETKEDFTKHYKNLSSYVGKKVEPKPAAPKPKANDSLLMEKLNKIEFLGEHPEAKEYYDEFIRPISVARGISLEEALAQVKPLVEASEAKKKEKEIGVESKNRIQSADFQKTKKLTSEARTGSPRAREEYVKEVVLKKFGF